MGRTGAELLRGDRHDAAFFAALESAIERGETWHGRLVSRHRDGRPVFQDATVSPLRDATGRLTHFVAVRRDIGERMRAEAALRGERGAAGRVHGARAGRHVPEGPRRPLPDAQPGDGPRLRPAGRRAAGPRPRGGAGAGGGGGGPPLRRGGAGGGRADPAGGAPRGPRRLRLEHGDPLPGARRVRPDRPDRRLRPRHHGPEAGAGRARGQRAAAARDRREPPGADEHHPARGPPPALRQPRLPRRLPADGRRSSTGSTGTGSTPTRGSAARSSRGWRARAWSRTTRSGCGGPTGRRSRRR